MPKKLSTVEQVSAPVQETKSVSKRVAHTFDSVDQEFLNLISKMEQGISDIKQGKLTTCVKFLKSLKRETTLLQKHTSRISRKRPTNRRLNSNGGFRKPVQISEALTKFTGWEPNKLYSRVDVTKYLCNYIKQKKLQNPVDKRYINADPALCELLNYDPVKVSNDKRLCYYSLQTYLKSHFKPVATPVVPAKKVVEEPKKVVEEPVKKAPKNKKVVA